MIYGAAERFNLADTLHHALRNQIRLGRMVRRDASPWARAFPRFIWRCYKFRRKRRLLGKGVMYLINIVYFYFSGAVWGVEMPNEHFKKTVRRVDDPRRRGVASGMACSHRSRRSRIMGRSL